MTISRTDLAKVRRVKIPSLKISELPHESLALHCFLEPEKIVEATATPVKEFRGRIKSIQINFDDSNSILVNREDEETLFTNVDFELKAKKFYIEGDMLFFSSDYKWTKHPRMLTCGLETHRDNINLSWNNAIRFVQEEIDSNGNVTKKGLHPAQIGALHSLAAHRIIETNSTIVVMPTGTGKTEVMLSNIVMQHAKCVLVLVPSDPLRKQTFQKLCTLGVLPNLGILSEGAKLPIVGIIRKTPKDNKILQSLKLCNVVVSTVAMLSNIPNSLYESFFYAFDVIYFDEAHHVPSNTWKNIYNTRSSKKTILFTATPFRFDGRRIPGDIIFNFPLRLAQEQGYFKKINFLEVDEIDQSIADEKIAEKAVKQLREDLSIGLNHMILARVDTKNRADELYGNIYKKYYSDLNPIVIYTGIPNKNKRLHDIKQGLHRIIICVDMFGEGFDLPSLKIAAMHNIHGSLAITLQFTGRFTRTGSNIGNATLIANIGDVKVEEAIEDLYAENADWNNLIPELSSKAIQSEIDYKKFLDGMSQGLGTEGIFALNILKPKTSTVIYRAKEFNHKNFKKGLKNQISVVREWVHVDHNTFVFITKTKSTIDWAYSKENFNEIWDLYILFYDPDRELLFINSSQKSTLHGDLAKAVTNGKARLVCGENIFRVLHGIERLIFHSAGLYGHGKLRFKMYTGLDIQEAISPVQQQNSTKSNLFAIGYELGRKTSIGASSKGRIWSMSSSSIPDWQHWCKSIADKINNNAIKTNAFLEHTLIPEEIDQLPEKEILSVILPDEWFNLHENDSRIFDSDKEIPFVQIEISSCKKINEKHFQFVLSWGTNANSEYEIRWGGINKEVSIVQLSGPKLKIQGRENSIDLVDFFKEKPPVIFLFDGSEIKGNLFFKRQYEQPFSYSTENINIIDWANTDITKESKWKNGTLRESSVQGRFIDIRKGFNNSFIIDDDDSGEIADIVEIIEDGTNVTIRLYHCKFSTSKTPSSRVKDLYELCGQAARSARWASRPEDLLKHIEEREKFLNGRQTRFEKGSLKELRVLRKAATKRKFNFEISIVQPGLSVSSLTKDHSSLLGSADNYIRELTGRRLCVFASK